MQSSSFEKTLAVVAGNKAQYESHVESDLLPYLEKTYDIKFLRREPAGEYFAPGKYRVFYVRSVEQLMGLHNYQLVKCGTFYEREDIYEIEERYKMEVASRMEEMSDEL